MKEYAPPNPPKADALVAMLDLTPTGLDLEAGDTLRYRAEVRDRRPNSEAIFSKDFTIRIAEDPKAADKLLDAFEKGQYDLKEQGQDDGSALAELKEFLKNLGTVGQDAGQTGRPRRQN